MEVEEIQSPPLIYNDELTDPLEHVFNYLTIKELCNLSQVSLKFYQGIGTFANRIYHNLSQDIVDGDSKNLHFYLKDELELKKRFSTLPRLQQYVLTAKWQKLCRHSVAKCHFAWINSLQYFEKKFDTKLDREIAHLKMVCWLEIITSFDQVSCGKYEFKIRLDIDRGNISREGANIFAKWEDSDGPHKRCVKLTSDIFYHLQKQLKTQKPTKMDVLKVAEGEGGRAWACNYDFGFFDFVLGDIDIASPCKVTCCLSDLGATWKQNMRYDYFELTPVDP